MNTRRRLLARWLASACALGLEPRGVAVAAAVADPAAWPARPIRLVVAYPPGGVSDLTARALAEPLSKALGVPVIVEHRPGAGGSVAIDLLQRAAPDGCTLVFSAISPLTLHPLLSHDVRDPLRRVHPVRPVAGVMRTPVLVAGTRALQGNTFEEVIDRARRFPGAVRWATSGVATIGHMVLAQVRLISSTSITHVPYAGGGAQLNDALSGQFEVLSSNVAALQLQYIANGALKALAVGSPLRLPALPDTPTLSELGYEQANLASLFGVFAPADTPEAVVQRLNAEINRVLASASMMELLRKGYNIPAPGSPEAFTAEIAADRARNRLVVDKAAGKLE